MNFEEIKQRLAPCGLHCGKCFAFTKGDIRKNSQKLKIDLGEFDVYAERFVNILNEPVFKNYPKFKEMLSYFSEAQCSGCRNEQCKIFKDCKVRGCSETKGVDFCFECNEFPCNNTGFDEHLHARSVTINKTMLEVGVDNYYHKIKDEPRY
ncbi:MAG: DUF3795 domain-containing protein [Salinivirgaceae bacterium]|jgi:hypothetical protein|nr:DUF3795 domain-containing protein [Salinivirgaceae bacterium]